VRKLRSAKQKKKKAMHDPIYKYASWTLIGSTLTCNALAFLVYSRRRFSRASSSLASASLYWRTLLAADTFGLLLYVVDVLHNAYGIDVVSHSSLTCSTLYYVLYVLSALSPWTLVLISFDRMAFISFPLRMTFCKRRSFQLRALAAVLVYCFVYYLEIVFYSRYEYLDVELAPSLEYFHSIFSLMRWPLVNSNSNTTMTMISYEAEKQCFWSKTSIEIIFYMDAINFTFLPFVAMLVMTAFTLRSIFASRRKLNISQHRNGISSRDVQFAITSIVSNVAFLAMTLPLNIYYLTSIATDRINDASNTFGTTLNAALNLVYYSYHGSSLAINLVFNSIFREELFVMLRIAKAKPKVAVLKTLDNSMRSTATRSQVSTASQSNKSKRIFKLSCRTMPLYLFNNNNNNIHNNLTTRQQLHKKLADNMQTTYFY
jgi:hypothetical protein